MTENAVNSSIFNLCFILIERHRAEVREAFARFRSSDTGTTQEVRELEHELAAIERRYLPTYYDRHLARSAEEHAARLSQGEFTHLPPKTNICAKYVVAYYRNRGLNL